MNTVPEVNHPAEEKLVEFALDSADGEVAHHVEKCAECARTVSEFREIGKRIDALPDDDVPTGVLERVMKMTRHGARGTGFADKRGAGSWLGLLFANPVFVTLLVALLILGLYFAVGSEIFKVP